MQKSLQKVLDPAGDLQYYLHVRFHVESWMPRFTPGELNVMRLLWEHGEMKPAEIQARFPEPIKNAALRSYLTILLEKRHVTRRKVGKAYYYQAITRRQSAFRTTLLELVDTYCGGSTQALMMNLIRAENVSREELLKLKSLADAGATQPPSGKSDPSSPKAAARARKPTRKSNSTRERRRR